MGKLLRLDKYLADMQVGTRTEVKQMIKKGLVTVNGSKAKKPEEKIDADSAEVFVNGERIGYAEFEYWMLHKPAGVVSATEDRHDWTVIDLLTESKRKDLFPVGRLDKDTEGLLLITNDGELAHELLSPKKHVDKTYYAKIDGVVTGEDVEKFKEGLDIGEKNLTMPARLEIIGTEETTSEIRVTIKEGKFHQVKRMFEAVGKKVTYLKRLSMGTLILDETLKTGEARLLTEEELHNLKAHGKENKKEIKAAIFDLDGTLIDSMWMWYKIDEEFLGQFGLPVPDDLQKSIEGMSTTETAEYFQRRFPEITYSIEEMKQIWNDMAYDKYAHEVTLKPGVLKFLKELKKHNIKTGIATSNFKELAEVALKNLGIREYFDSIRTSCEVEKGKPAPDIYLLVAKDLGVKPEQCMVFEDVPAGIMAGKSAGMMTFAVADAFSEHMLAEKKELADHFIEDYFVLLP